MQVTTGTVVSGKIVADESFSLTEAQENEFLAAAVEIERGEYVTLKELLQSLPKHI